jgi:hypothetical protein
VKQCTEQARITKANGEFMQPGVAMRVQGSNASGFTAKTAQSSLAAGAKTFSDGPSKLYSAVPEGRLAQPVSHQLDPRVLRSA